MSSRIVNIVKRPFGRPPSPSTPLHSPTVVDATYSDKNADHFVVDRQETLEPQVGEQGLLENSAGGLGRHLGLVSTTFLIIGRIIGTGIFSTPSSIVSSVGSVGAALLLWLAGLIISFAGLFIWLELGCMIPRSGGEKVYLEAAYRHPKLLATVVFAVQAILLGFTASGCIVFASNVILASGKTATDWEKRGIAIVVISFITLLHTFFPKIGVSGMNALGVLKVVLLLFIVVTGWVSLSDDHPRSKAMLTSSRQSLGERQVTSRILMRASVTHLLVVRQARICTRRHFSRSSIHTQGEPSIVSLSQIKTYRIDRWNNAAYVLNEVRNPVRTLKIAGPLGLGTCGVLYMLANVAYFAAETPKEVAASKVTVASHFMGAVFGPAAQKALR